MNFLCSILLAIILTGCATLTTQSNYDLGKNHLADGNFEAAYRLFEDPSPGKEAEIRNIMMSNPQIVEAGFLTFSVDALNASMQLYGRERSYSIEKHRLERFKQYSRAEQYLVAESNINSEFQKEAITYLEKERELSRVSKLSADEQTKYYQEKAKALREASTFTGVILSVQSSNESHINTGVGAQLGAAYGQAAYIDNTNIWRYRATSQINSGLAGAIIGGLLDKPSQVKYRTVYHIKLLNGDVKRFDLVSSDQIHIPASVCVEFSEPFYIEAVNQRKCASIQDK